FDDEHHRVAPQGARVEFAQRIRCRLPQHLRVEQAALHPFLARGGRKLRLVSRIDGGRGHQWIPSARGPSASMGRKVRATRINVTPATIPTNCGRWVGRVPTDSGVVPCLASEPARASTSTIGRNLPKTMASPRAVLYQLVLTLIPANADPLLFAAEVNAYNTSDSPCGPVLSMPARSPGSAIAIAVPVSTINGVTRK